MSEYLSRVQKRLFFSLSIFLTSIAFGQVSIKGATCVVTGLVYQYDITGEWKQNDKISICIEGGILTESNTTCIDKQSVSFIRVKWGENKTSGKITVNSQEGTADISVNIALSFNAGSIETPERQTVTATKIPTSLSCTEARGGNCSPSFSYQWEQSFDRLHWVTLSGATARNLSFTVPLAQTTFFRRRVLESKSHTIGYTNQVAVFVIPQAKKN